MLTLSVGMDWHALEVQWLKELNLHRLIYFDGFFQFVSYSVPYVAWGLPGVLLLVGFLQKRVEFQRKSLLVWISVLIASLINSFLKYIVDRARPFDTYEFIEKLSSGGSPSFPSGHTTDAFALAVALIIAYPRWYVVWPALLWASVVGYTRMSLGVHYPSDVAAGVLIGVGSALLCLKGKECLKRSRHLKL